MKPILKMLLLGATGIFLQSVQSSSAQAPTIQWQKALGGSGDDRARAIQQTIDGDTSQLAIPNQRMEMLPGITVIWSMLICGLLSCRRMEVYNGKKITVVPVKTRLPMLN